MRDFQPEGGPNAASLWWAEGSRTPTSPWKGSAPWGGAPSRLVWAPWLLRPLRDPEAELAATGPNGSQGVLHPAQSTSVVLNQRRGLSLAVLFADIVRDRLKPDIWGVRTKSHITGFRSRRPLTPLWLVCALTDPGFAHVSICLYAWGVCSTWPNGSSTPGFSGCVHSRLQPPACLPASVRS